ncbi:type II toxin-antitoxin system HicA family toxin [Burkholderia sp. Bp8963]|uniref:type II toxin-antitoxin system HicA family toxin n=1 Tax=Burkholderia sp. Bp8963 TaxID=2184547 RepID=UPI003908316C
MTGFSGYFYTPHTQIFLAFLHGVYRLHTGSGERGYVWRQLWRRTWCGVMDSRTVIRRLEQDGWVQKRVKGSHHHFRHASKPGTVTVPHPEKDLTIATLKSIERQSGLTLTGQ